MTETGSFFARIFERAEVTAAALILGVLVSSGATNAFGCTIITLARDGRILIGNNEDWTDPRTRMWIIPAASGEYGRVCFGFAEKFIQGGINEHGLFLDANALPPVGWKPDPAKPVFENDINDYILAHCATVEDAIAFFKKYSVFLGGGKFVIADASGDSIVVEWAEGTDRISRRKGFYQISTNIPQWNIVPGNVADKRYNIAEKVILSRNEVSVPAVRAVLAATHQEWAYPTIYSYICDLNTLRVYIYNFHDFEEVYELDLLKELNNGRQSYEIPALFTVSTYASISHDLYAPKLGIVELRKKIAEAGLDEAVRWYESVKDRHRKIPEFTFFEGLIQQLGDELLEEDKKAEALAVFEFNTHVFPKSPDVWEQLGDACLKTGNAGRAGKNYEKALTLNPGNQKVRDKLDSVLK
jgi:tetratricopeptide (TPR) repeat protein